LKILVVDDDLELQRLIAFALRQAGYLVLEAGDGPAALAMFESERPDLVLLDVNLPRMNGFEVLRRLRAGGAKTPVMMLTVRVGEEDQVRGLDLGADDYLAKPFAMQELVARVRALGRRVSSVVPPVLHHHDLTLDTPRRRATRDGRELKLTRKEFGVLEVLMAAGDRVVSSEELLEKVWDENADPFTNAVRITVMTLRRKLGEPQVIETVVGVGYRLS
jgi:DNA-binding response OmpR family regulator